MARKTLDDLRRPLLVGEAPSRSGDRYHMFPLSGRVARTLCTLAGISPQDEGSTYGRWTWALYDHFECVNVFERYAQATPWDVNKACTRFAEIVMGGRPGPRVIVCLGRRVQAAMLGWFNGNLAFGGDDFYDWNVAVRGDDPLLAPLVDVVSIPHPSWLNRLLNDPEQRELCGATLREAMSR